MSYIEFKNVIKTYGEGQGAVNALDGVDFTVEKGEFCVLLGESGAGKTTLLNMLGGMDTITSGTILFNGRDVSSLSKKELVEYIGGSKEAAKTVATAAMLENNTFSADDIKSAVENAETRKKIIDTLPKKPGRIKGHKVSVI